MTESVSDKLFSVLGGTSTENSAQKIHRKRNSQDKLNVEKKSAISVIQPNNKIMEMSHSARIPKKAENLPNKPKLFSALVGTSTENSAPKIHHKRNSQDKLNVEKKGAISISQPNNKITEMSHSARTPKRAENLHNKPFSELPSTSTEKTAVRRYQKCNSIAKIDYENQSKTQFLESISISNQDIATHQLARQVAKCPSHHSKSSVRRPVLRKNNTLYTVENKTESNNRDKRTQCQGPSFARAPEWKVTREKDNGPVISKGWKSLTTNTSNASVDIKQKTFPKYNKDNPIYLDRYDTDKMNFADVKKTNKMIKGTGYKFLEKLLEDEPTEVVVRLASPKTGFEEFLKKEMFPELIFLVLRVIAEKVCVAGFHHNKISVLISACQTSFLDHLGKHIIDIITEEKKARIDQFILFFENLLVFYETILTLLPSTAREKFKNLFIKTEMAIVGIKNYHNINSDTIKNKFDSLFTQLKHKIEENERDSVKESSRMEQLKYIQPPDDFRNCNIFPTIEDFTEKPFLRPSIVKGSYIDANHYLDVQFRLLREDFIGPLREGIAQYIEHSTAGKKGFRNIDNIKIYCDVSFQNTLVVKDKVGLLLDFDPNKKLQNVQWEYSKRFLFGSLLCFTADNFGTFFFGTVLERDKKMLGKGLILVQLYNEVDARIFNCKFTMAESEVYFEPYRQVLQALQAVPASEFPMKPYIVDGITDVGIPLYIHINPNRTYNIGDFEVPITEMDCWPSAELLGMDSAQHRSFQNALTKEFVIIQGPPGTGKTFLGLKIIETLLHNHHIWNCDARPILVVCYTNHALDQVLEGTLKYTDKLIRVGGQSQSEMMAKFNLSEARKSFTNRKSSATSRETFLRMKDVLNEINSLQSQMNSISENKGIISIHLLKQIGISSKHIECFKNCVGDIDDIFVEWLTEALDISVFDQHTGFFGADSFIPENVKNGEGGQVKNDDDEEEEDDDDDENRLREMWEERYEVELNAVCITNIRYVLHLENIHGEITNIIALMECYKDDLEQQQKSQQYLIYRQCLYRFLQQHLSIQHDDGGHKVGQLLQVHNLWELNNTQRWTLYKHWCSRLQAFLLNRLCQRREEYHRLCLQYDEIRDIQDLQVMREAHVVGMTTSGAARKQPILQELKPRIVVVEEAAEVLESHVVVSLTKSCEHLILIGDHKQLRPSTAVYQLARKFNFDISLFERMLKNGMHYDCLEVQHRMRPEIVELITPTIYPTLLNATSVYQYPDVQGVTKNLYFIDHKFYEEKIAETSSHRNVFEAKFLIAFCRYLLLQGYKDSEITILTTYSGQMHYMRRLKKESGSLGNVRITIVDNFQGEENKIILLSLVRSNEENKIGFLKIENRVCVALSRAREGFYIIGNMQSLTASSNMWGKIKEILEKKESFGSHLTLKCQVHPGQETKVASAADFKAVSEGGCSLLCHALLSCGHKCQSICHVQNRFHENYKCFFQCERTPKNCPLGHICLKKCYEECGGCEMPLEKKLPCQHVETLACHVDVNDYKCKEPVEVKLKLCGHTNTKLCFVKEEHVHCQFPCEERLPCGHSCTKRCHAQNDPDHLEYKCLKQCEKKNKNCKRDHKCPKRCHEDCGECKVEVKVKLDCGHTHQLPCSADLSSVKCSRDCKRKMSCGHICRLSCFQPCGNCPVKVEKAIPDCGHIVSVACCKNPTRDLCKKSCERNLPCGHQCKGLCRNPCTLDCEELVPSPIKPACGHGVVIPCYWKGKELSPDSVDLLQMCEMPCGKPLECGHTCHGTCGSCLQGRIHIPCKEKCGRVQICGHSCNINCAKTCPPCQKKCEYRCKHSRCSRKCGVPCVQCMEPCEWRCKHSRCTRLCHEICNREPCYEACDKKLRCGHECVGFCGEPCPPLCRICNKDELTGIFFGTEDEEDARFVFLEDCKHTLESQGLEEWLQQTDKEIKLKSCPLCKTDIKRTLRFMNYVKNIYIDIINVKKKVFGNMREIREKKEVVSYNLSIIILPVTLTRDSQYVRGLMLSLKEALQFNKKGKMNFISLTDLDSLSVKVDILTNLVNTVKHFEKRLDTANIKKHLDTANIKKLTNHFDVLLSFLIKRNDHMSEQEVIDFNLETKRFTRMAQLYHIESTPEFKKYCSVQTVSDLHFRALQIIKSIQRYDDIQDAKIKNIVDSLDRQFKTTAAEDLINIRKVVKAIGLAPGHWFKCPNEHYYAIGECGGAMQEGKCPDCGVKIGGQSHRLLADNSHAPELDGSAAPAYPTVHRF